MAMAYRKVPGYLTRFPESYRKFFLEWKYGKQAPVHYIPEEGNWKRDPETGQVTQIQNKPLPLTYPKEFEYGLWGGEAVVRGFVKRKPLRRRVPHFWFPSLQKYVFHSEILDKHMEITVTQRTLQLVDQHYGFDNYILETPPQDLKSTLGVKLKRELLLALAKKDFLPNNPAKREELLEKYKAHIIPLEEAEWYGLTLQEAKEKLIQEEAAEIEKQTDRQPLKLKFRAEFLQQLKDKKTQEVTESLAASKSSWTSKLNPFRSNKSV